MKRETFIRIAKKCVKGVCDAQCPHNDIEIPVQCKNELIMDAVMLIAAGNDIKEEREKKNEAMVR